MGSIMGYVGFCSLLCWLWLILMNCVCVFGGLAGGMSAVTGDPSDMAEDVRSLRWVPRRVGLTPHLKGGLVSWAKGMGLKVKGCKKVGPDRVVRCCNN